MTKVSVILVCRFKFICKSNTPHEVTKYSKEDLKTRNCFFYFFLASLNNVHQKLTSTIIFMVCVEIRFPTSIQQIHSAIQSSSVVLSSTSLTKQESKGVNQERKSSKFIVIFIEKNILQFFTISLMIILKEKLRKILDG